MQTLLVGSTLSLGDLPATNLANLLNSCFMVRDDEPMASVNNPTCLLAPNMNPH